MLPPISRALLLKTKLVGRVLKKWKTRINPNHQILYQTNPEKDRSLASLALDRVKIRKDSRDKEEASIFLRNRKSSRPDYRLRSRTMSLKRFPILMALCLG